MNNAIVANNSATGSGPDIAGTITSNDYNLVEDTSGATFTPQANDLTGVDPLLGPLADNGGETNTHALLGGSPAIDAGDTSLTTDQRGVTRPQFGVDDIGAYESLCGTATSWTAATEFELDTAIGCFNKQTVAGSYTITVTGNFTVTGGPPAIDNPTSGPSLVIEGGNYTIEGNGRQGFGIQSATAVTMNNLTLTDWRNLLGGGAIRHNNVDSHLMLNNMTLTHNTSGFGAGALYSRGWSPSPTAPSSAIPIIQLRGGGAIDILGPGKLTLIDSELTDNAAAGNGGAILAESNPTIIIERSRIVGNMADVEGGGIFNEGSLTIEQSTVSGNTATDTGGGVANSSTATVEIRNSTLSGNTTSGTGGGLVAGGTVTLDSTTVANNTASSIGGGVYLKGAGVLTLLNSILGDNTSTGVPGTADCGRFGGTTLSGSYNLLEVESCDFGELTNTVNADPNLGPLANNGGPTFTHALLPGSPAINAGDTALTTDQRGEPRPAGAADDIGAFESQTATLTIVKETVGGDDTFEFGSTVNSEFRIPVFSLTTQGGTAQQTLSGLNPGFYEVGEAVPQGWMLTNIVCDVLYVFDGNLAKLNLAPGDDVTCTFTNVKGPFDLTIVKAAVGGDGTFAFEQTVNSDVDFTDFSLTTAGGTAQTTLTDLPAGFLEIEEIVPAGWKLTDVECVGVTDDDWGFNVQQGPPYCVAGRRHHLHVHQCQCCELDDREGDGGRRRHIRHWQHCQQRLCHSRIQSDDGRRHGAADVERSEPRLLRVGGNCAAGMGVEQRRLRCRLFL